VRVRKHVIRSHDFIVDLGEMREAVYGYEEYLKAILGSDREPVSLN
jgi:hypothetical protein